MKFAFRADASSTIGTGHVVRCATLADELQLRGARVVFFCREAPGHMCGWLEDKGYEVRRLPGPAASLQLEIEHMHTALGAERFDWLVVDHYGLDATWERAMAPLVGARFVIDDIGRAHDCELLLDQNILDDANIYLGHVSASCRCLLGPRYALLRPEFIAARGRMAPRNGAINSILISFGGSDPTGEIPRALEATLEIPWTGTATVVMGSANSARYELISRYSHRPALMLIEQSNAMAELMAAAGLAIGAGGSTTWERCCLGLPSVVIPVAANQLPTARALANAGIIEIVEAPVEQRQQAIAGVIARLLQAPERCRHMAQSGMALVDGRGANRVAEVLVTYGRG